MVDDPNTPAADPWAAFKPEAAQGPQPQAISPAAATAGPAPGGDDPWAAFKPEADHGNTAVPPAFSNRLQTGQAIGTAAEKQGGVGESFKAIWNAAKQGASAGYDADGLRKLWKEQKDGIDQLTGGQDTFGGWTYLRTAAESAENFYHALNGAFTGAQAAVAQAGEEIGQPQLGRDLAALPEAFGGSIHPTGIPKVPRIPDFDLPPAIVARNGEFARVVKDEETGQLHAQIVGTMPKPEDFKAAAQRLAPDASEAAQSKVEAVLRKQWDVQGMHPAEVEEAVANSNARASDVLAPAHDLSAASSPAPVLPPRPSPKYLKELDDGLFKLRGAHTADQAEMLERIKNMPEQFKSGDVQERMYRYMEGDPEVRLTEEEGKFYNEHIAPLKKEELELYERAKATDLDVDQYDPTYVHRMVIGKTPGIDRLSGEGGVSANPISSLSNEKGMGLLSRTSASMNPRTYFALESEAGARRIVRMSNDGKSLREVDKGGPIKIDVTDRKLKLGDDISAADQNWKLVNARTAEIEQHTPNRYYKNALLSTIDNVMHLRAANRAIFRIQQIRDTPEYNKYTSRGAGAEVPDNWISPEMPLFKNDRMDPKLAHIIDDFYGTKDTDTLLDALERVNQAAISSLFWTPVPHAMNAGAHWFMGRGWDWITPSGLKSLMVDGSTAIKEVVTQGPKYRQLLREGNSLIYGGVANKNFLTQVMQQVGVAIKNEPEGWEGLAKIVGAEPAKLIGSFYDASSRALWGISDVFMMQRVLELEAKGMSTSEAIDHAEKHIPNYRVPSDLPGMTFGNKDFGRTPRQLFTNPILFEFSRYHYGIMKGYANLAKDLAVGDAGQKMEAVGQIMALAALQMVIWPGLSHLLQLATGKNDVEVPSFGPGRLAAPAFAAIADHWHGGPAWLHEYYEKTNPDFISSLYQLASLSPGFKVGIAAMTNTDAFTGRKVVEPSDWRAGNYGNVAGQAADWTARTMVEPYNAFNDAWKHGEDAKDVLLKNVLGLKTGTEEAEAGRLRAFKYQDREARGRHRKPLGYIEHFMTGDK